MVSYKKEFDKRAVFDDVDGFCEEYRTYDEETSKIVNSQLLRESERAVVEENHNDINRWFKFYDSINKINTNDITRNRIDCNNLLTIAAKYKKVNIIDYILKNKDLHVMFTYISPKDMDSESHNAFYYAMRSNNVTTLKMLIEKWPGGLNLRDTESVLSKCYEELKMKNVPLTEQMQYYVEDKLINVRTEVYDSKKSALCNAMQRIKLIVEIVESLKGDSNRQVDDVFLYKISFIAKNIHVLKRQMKWTYSHLPWEEIEFCLIIFVLSNSKPHPNNIFYLTTLKKSKILLYLNMFFIKLLKENYAYSNNRDALSSTTKRKKVIENIIKNTPRFEQLYNDYEKVRDIYSLDKIKIAIDLALSANTKKQNDRLTILRCLPITREYLKNSLESPKLSQKMCQLLLLSIPKKTREILIDLRNSLSHSYSLSKRLELEKKDIEFFDNTVNDMEKIRDVIMSVMNNNKLREIRALFSKFIQSETNDCLKILEEVNEALQGADMFNSFDNSQTYRMIEMLKSAKELKNIVGDFTTYESELFQKIRRVCVTPKNSLTKGEGDYLSVYATLKTLAQYANTNISKFDNNVIQNLKIQAKETLRNLNVSHGDDKDVNFIRGLLIEIAKNAKPRLQSEQLEKLYTLISDLIRVDSVDSDINWLEDFNEKLHRHNKKKNINSTNYFKGTEEGLLESKITTLEMIIKDNKLARQVPQNFTLYRKNKKLQSAIEILVLDILTLLSKTRKTLDNNLLVLDANLPLLSCKSLRNFLAHDSAIQHILAVDPIIAIISNALKIRDIKERGNMYGRNYQDIKNSYCERLFMIQNHVDMKHALIAGDIDKLLYCIANGSEIFTKSKTFTTTLHLAAQSPNLVVVKYISKRFGMVDVRDVYGQSPLHVAAANGRESTVEYFIREESLPVNQTDEMDKTPLHHAGFNGQRGVVLMLLKSRADKTVKDLQGLSPSHYAVMHNDFDILKMIIQKQEIDKDYISGGCTMLHLASERGFVDIVKFLIQNKAKVNATNDFDGAPIHLATFNGYIDVVQALISHGADVNLAQFDGRTALHDAVENSHEAIVRLLLKHGANVDGVKKNYEITPFHHAVSNGCFSLVQLLFDNGADINAPNDIKETPLILAAKHGRTEIANFLISKDALIDSKDHLQNTALHLCSYKGHIDIVKLLLSKGADIKMRNNSGHMPLHMAALGGCTSVVDLLIEEGALINGAVYDGSTALHLAVSQSFSSVVELLIKKECNVNAENSRHVTALHSAAEKQNSMNEIKLLLKSKDTDINKQDIFGYTPLHRASLHGNSEAVTVLLEQEANVNLKNARGDTPLYCAIEGNHTEIIRALIDKGAEINITNKNEFTPLCLAIENNYVEAADILIKAGADINTMNGKPLVTAVLAGFTKIVEFLIDNKNIDLNARESFCSSLVNTAASNGHVGIVETLLGTGGAEFQEEAMIQAIKSGHRSLVESLLDKGAKVNHMLDGGNTYLHAAASLGHCSIVEVLLSAGIDFSVRNEGKRTAFELAVIRGNVPLIKVFLESGKINVNETHEGVSALQFPVMKGDIGTIKILVENGANIDEKDVYGLKPIQNAAREGHKETVEYFLSKGISVDNVGGSSETLLHLAAVGGRAEIVQYLLDQKADVHKKDANEMTPLHVAAYCNRNPLAVIKILLTNGAFLDSKDKFGRTPIDLSSNEDVTKLLVSTDELFKAVSDDDLDEVKRLLDQGAVVDAHRADNVCPLHLASWKGSKNIVECLLVNHANPNILGKNHIAPLHYAAKFSHWSTVTSLLTSGAMHDIKDDNDKTPLDYASHERIVKTLKFIRRLFFKVQNNDVLVITDLKKVKDAAFMRVVRNARNNQNKELVGYAFQCGFSKMDELKQAIQQHVAARIAFSQTLADQDNYAKALKTLENTLDEVTGESPGIHRLQVGVIEIKKQMANVVFKQSKYKESLKLYDETYQLQKEMFGDKCKDTLNTRSRLALVYHRMGKDKDAMTLFKGAYEIQKSSLGSDHRDTTYSQFHLSIVLHTLKFYDEAFKMNSEVYEINRRILGAKHPFTISAQNNMAMVLCNLGELDRSLEIYNEVYRERKASLGAKHPETQRCLRNSINVLLRQNKYENAFKMTQDIFNNIKRKLGPAHGETLQTEYVIGNTLFIQGKYRDSLKVYKRSYDKFKTVFGPDHPIVTQVEKQMRFMHEKLQMQGFDDSKFPTRAKILNAVNGGDLLTIKKLIQNGGDIDVEDEDGRSALHLAVINKQLAIVQFLLKNGADVTAVGRKGSSVLHTAVNNGDKKMVETLIEHAKLIHLNTSVLVSRKESTFGLTPLHIAGRKGFLDIVKILLKNGGIYNALDLNRKTPRAYTNSTEVLEFLKLTDRIFKCSSSNNEETINEMKVLETCDVVTILNARNSKEETPIDIAKRDNHSFFSCIPKKCFKALKKLNKGSTMTTSPSKQEASASPDDSR